MSFKRYLIEYGFFKNRYAYMHNFRKYLHESKNNPKEDLVIPEEKIVKDFCSQQDTVITVTQLLLKHFNKYIETLDNIKTNKDNTINELKRIFDIKNREDNIMFLEKLRIDIDNPNPNQICDLLKFISSKLNLLINNYQQYHEFFAGCSFILGNNVENQNELPDINGAKNKYYVAFVYIIPSTNIEKYFCNFDSDPIKNQIYLKFDFRTICQIQNDGYNNKRIPVKKLDNQIKCISVSKIQKNSQVYTISIHDNF